MNDNERAPSTAAPNNPKRRPSMSQNTSGAGRGEAGVNANGNGSGSGSGARRLGRSGSGVGPVNLADAVVAYQRKNAARAKLERSERPERVERQAKQEPGVEDGGRRRLSLSAPACAARLDPTSSASSSRRTDSDGTLPPPSGSGSRKGQQGGHSHRKDKERGEAPGRVYPPEKKVDPEYRRDGSVPVSSIRGEERDRGDYAGRTSGSGGLKGKEDGVRSNGRSLFNPEFDPVPMRNRNEERRGGGERYKGTFEGEEGFRDDGGLEDRRVRRRQGNGDRREPKSSVDSRREGGLGDDDSDGERGPTYSRSIVPSSSSRDRMPDDRLWGRMRRDIRSRAEGEGHLSIDTSAPSLSVGGVGGSNTVSSASPVSLQSRQLFDYRKDDPVRFSATKRAANLAASAGSSSANANGGYVSTSTASTSASDARSMGSSNFTATSTSNAGSAVSAGSRRKDGDSKSGRSGGGGAAGGKEVDELDRGGTGSSTNPIFNQLKAAYREIVALEIKLQDEHRASAARAQRDEQVRDRGDHLGEEGGHMLRVSSNGPAVVGGNSVANKVVYDDEYWVKLAQGHRSLAEAHHNFLEMALDPRLPASLHSLPQKYNIPTRLWQTAFHQLLERMRHAIIQPSALSQSEGHPSSSSSEPSSSNANVLEHWTDFIHYAYSFYTNLLEEPPLAVFRSAWIEQLGDLARYRMAVAGVMSRLSGQSSRNAAAASVSNASTDWAEATEMEENEGSARGGGSIGDAALGDWGLDEQETWRNNAKDWYGKGLMDTPGNGRLHHHLALLSKDDELRALYHYVKSLCTTHPYVSARESILALFEQERQARRAQPDVTAGELFVHLHGMLFTKINLDDFEEVSARFFEILTEDYICISKGSGLTKHEGQSIGPITDSKMIMMAVINIAACLQYGAEEGVLNRCISSKDSPPISAARTEKTAATRPNSMVVPQAIMLHPSSARKQDNEDGHKSRSLVEDVADVESLAASDLGSSPGSGAAEEVVKRLSLNDLDRTEADDSPIAFQLAVKFAFTMLEFVLAHPERPDKIHDATCPYITVLLTFISLLAENPAAMKKVERQIPWQPLIHFLNGIPRNVEVKSDVPSKLVGTPLPEDWCVRGMEWVGRQLFSRGYWKPRTPKIKEGQPLSVSQEVRPSTMSTESEMEVVWADAQRMDAMFSADVSSSGSDHEGINEVAEGRWKRIVTCAAWLAKSVPGLGFDPSARKFAVLGSLEHKLARWRKEEEEEIAERNRNLQAKWSDVNEFSTEESDEEEEEEEEDDSEDADLEADDEAVRALKARRRELKAVIRQAKEASRARRAPARFPQPKPVGPDRQDRHVKKVPRKRQQRPGLNALAGYTVLVFDTNILLSSLQLFARMVKSCRWTLIVPLAVVTELDGLQASDGALGSNARAAVQYLEENLKAYNKNLKVQTSRGNYLSDIAIRYEDIDFSAKGGLTGSSARSMDDIILRALSWQFEHFVDRRTMINPGNLKVSTTGVSKAALVTFDRNLRLKARARDLDAADERDLTRIFLQEGHLERVKDNG